MKISKITLGTAQFGSKYGISNKKGKPSIKSIYEMLDVCKKNGINSFDTAPSYGNSEKILGDYFKNRNSLTKSIFTTKISLPEINKITSNDIIYKKIKGSVLSSINSLCVKKIEICLFHNSLHLMTNNDNVIKNLIKMKDEKLVKMIGISVYSPYEVKKFLELDLFDVIQIPINIFDHRLIKSGLIDELKKSKTIVFGRSVYLQGLFFVDPYKIPYNFNMAKKYLLSLIDISKKFKISIPQIAFSFVRDFEQVNSMIIGCQNPSQINRNLEYLKTPTLPNEIYEDIFKEFKNLPEKIINPSLWSKLT